LNGTNPKFLDNDVCSPKPRHWRGWASLGGGFAAALAQNEADFNTFGRVKNVGKESFC